MGYAKLSGEERGKGSYVRETQVVPEKRVQHRIQESCGEQCSRAERERRVAQGERRRQCY